jgi:MFS family permease
VTAFILTGVFGLLWANASSEAMVLAIGFCMIFCTQLAGNSSQIFISEVFPTNARASGFGLAQAAGRIGAVVAIPSILWIYTGFGLNVVFAMIAVMARSPRLPSPESAPSLAALPSTKLHRQPNDGNIGESGAIDEKTCGPGDRQVMAFYRTLGE